MSQVSVYFNGEWIPDSQLCIPVDDAGFLLGATVTERLRTFRGEVFRMDEHLRRLRRSLEIVGLDSRAIIDDVSAAIPEFLHRNEGQIESGDDWSVIAFVTPGVSGSNRPTVCVHGYPLPFKSWGSFYERGLPVVISSIRQVPPNCLPPELKCRSRMHFYLADREAATRKPGARAILLDQDGYVAEATTANVVVFCKGEGLISPPADHILYGVSLSVVEKLAAKINVPFITRRLTVDEFCTADEALITSTSICALPITECEGNPIGNGRPGTVYRQLLAAWNDLVGVDVADQALRFSART
jgi:branched-subunit amino acid aminotransferase/4-amino-4-deoxychorismate lyase